MSLKLNGEPAEFLPGERLVDVIGRGGFQVARDCQHARSEAIDPADVCTVRIDGRLARACEAIAQEGMNIVTSLPLTGGMHAEAFDRERARQIIENELGREGPLLPILHGLQQEFGYVPREAEPLIADLVNITRAEVHGVVSFYHDFRRAPAGRHVLKLCRAEACQSMGSEGNAQRLLKKLGLGWGGITPDGALSVEPVYCLGLCATAPGALLDGEPLGRVNAEQLEQLAADLAVEAKR